MGLSDIDEDGEPVHKVPSKTTAAMTQFQSNSFTAEVTSLSIKRTINLDDLFNDAKPQSDSVNSSVKSPVSPMKSKYVPNNPLDSLFMSPPPNSSSHINNSSTGELQRNIIYVDCGDAATHDDSDLFDTSRPFESCTFNTPESLLDDFEMQGKKTKPRRSAVIHNTLKHLTRNKDDNKVKARLLSLMNYYDVLGVHHDAAVEVIRRRYKEKALELHPDRVGRAQSSEEIELFKVMTQAHEVLTDPEKRSKYNRELQSKGFNAPF